MRTISRKGSKVLTLDVDRIPVDIGYYLAGFADGEGSFNVSFRRRRDYPQAPWKVSLCFNVSQRDEAILRLFQRQLRCGTMRARADGVWYFEVNRLDEITWNVIPFFERFEFLSAKKQRDFAKFQELALLMKDGKHLTHEGLRLIVKIRSGMNDGGARRRKYADAQILSLLGESSEAIR